MSRPTIPVGGGYSVAFRATDGTGGSAMGTGPMEVLTETVFPRPFQIIGADILMLSYRSPTGGRSGAVPEGGTVAAPESTAVLPEDISRPSARSW